jgi:hypothetical protein
MSESDDDMVLFTRTYDLLNWLLPKAERFPKLYRSTVTQRLMAATLDFQESLLEAQVYDGKIRLRHLKNLPWPRPASPGNRRPIARRRAFTGSALPVVGYAPGPWRCGQSPLWDGNG